MNNFRGYDNKGDQLPICIDDYGVAVYKCRYTKNLVWVSNAKKFGAFIKYAKITFIMEKSPIAEALYKEDLKLFYDSEANCNTCKYLKRVKHEKNNVGWLYGECLNNNYAQGKLFEALGKTDRNIRFHPDDPMRLQCYNGRI